MGGGGGGVVGGGGRGGGGAEGGGGGGGGEDTGPGMPPEVRARAFEPFFTTMEQGSGLGLAIVQKIVEANGGTVKVESEAGKGTTFRMRFPIAR